MLQVMSWVGQCSPAFAELAQGLKTEKSPFEAVFGKPLFDWFGDHPEQGQLFARAMNAASEFGELHNLNPGYPSPWIKAPIS